MLNLGRAALCAVMVSALFVVAVSASLLSGISISISTVQLFLVFSIVTVLGIRFAVGVKSRRLNESFVTQYSQMDSIINNFPFIIFLKDTDGKVLLANNHLAKFLNIKIDKIVGKNIYKIYTGSQIDFEEDKKILTTGNGTTSERQVEMNNTKHWFKVTKIPIKDVSGNVIRVIVILVNTDVEKALEGDKSSYIANLTHDLKTPTSAQIRAADLLLSGLLGELSSEQKEIITQIKSSCNYMNDLIFTILDSYMYDNGQTNITLASFDIVELVSETAAELSNLLTGKGQQIRVYPESNQIYVVADRFQIKRVIVNLLGNAITYGLKNSIINISIKSKPTSVNVNVRNKGEYIPSETINEMFKKFKHTSSARYQRTGTGLGLYLSKQIIDAHRGRVYAKSDTNQNCDFGFEIPKSSLNVSPKISEVTTIPNC